MVKWSPPQVEPAKSLGERLAQSRYAEFGIGEPAPADAHPRIARAIELWKTIGPPAGALPGRRHFDPLMAPDLLNNIWLVDVVPGQPPRFRFRLVGGAAVDAGTGFRKGLYVTEVGSAEEGALATRNFTEQMRTRRAQWRRGPSTLGRLKYVHEIERVALPMAADGVNVDLFMCVTVFYYSDGREL